MKPSGNQIVLSLTRIARPPYDQTVKSESQIPTLITRLASVSWETLAFVGANTLSMLAAVLALSW